MTGENSARHPGLCNLSVSFLKTLISHFQFSFLKVFVQLPFGNYKVSIRYDKGMG